MSDKPLRLLLGFDYGTKQIGVACFVAYLCSGHNGIYLSQRVAIPKVPADGLAPDATLRETRTRRTALRAQNRVS